MNLIFGAPIKRYICLYGTLWIIQWVKLVACIPVQNFLQCNYFHFILVCLYSHSYDMYLIPTSLSSLFSSSMVIIIARHTKLVASHLLMHLLLNWLNWSFRFYKTLTCWNSSIIGTLFSGNGQQHTDQWILPFVLSLI